MINRIQTLGTFIFSAREFNISGETFVSDNDIYVYSNDCIILRVQNGNVVRSFNLLELPIENLTNIHYLLVLNNKFGPDFIG